MEQAALILNTSKTNSVRLKDLYMRPVLGSRRIQVRVSVCVWVCVGVNVCVTGRHCIQTTPQD